MHSASNAVNPCRSDNARCAPTPRDKAGAENAANRGENTSQDRKLS